MQLLREGEQKTEENKKGRAIRNTVRHRVCRKGVVFQYVNFKVHKQTEYLLSGEDYNTVIQHVQENGLCMV